MEQQQLNQIEIRTFVEKMKESKARFEIKGLIKSKFRIYINKFV